MKHLEIPLISNIEINDTMKIISDILDLVGKNTVETTSWDAFTYKPKVSFSMAYNDGVFIKFYVEEDNIKASYRNANDPVYKDSCVEFFIAFDDSIEYYNFEFNCLGTCLLGYGVNRNSRKLISPKIISQIRTETLIKSVSTESENFIAWELTLAIPTSVFCFHAISNLKGQLAKANFFKCGDETKEKHYLSWNTIDTKEPDFHQPESFGMLLFN